MGVGPSRAARVGLLGVRKSESPSPRRRWPSLAPHVGTETQSPSPLCYHVHDPDNNMFTPGACVLPTCGLNHVYRIGHVSPVEGLMSSRGQTP